MKVLKQINGWTLYPETARETSALNSLFGVLGNDFHFPQLEETSVAHEIEKEKELINREINKQLARADGDFFCLGRNIFLKKSEIRAVVYTGVAGGNHKIEITFTDSDFRNAKNIRIPVGDAHKFINA